MSATVSFLLYALLLGTCSCLPVNIESNNNLQLYGGVALTVISVLVIALLYALYRMRCKAKSHMELRRKFIDIKKEREHLVKANNELSKRREEDKSRYFRIIFDRSKRLLEKVIEGGDIEEIKEYVKHRGIEDVSEALKIAIRYNQCHMLEYIGAQHTAHDRGILERLLRNEIENSKPTPDSERIRSIGIIKVLLRLVARHSKLDRQLLSWAIENSYWELIWKLVKVNGKSAHLDLNESNDCPSPVLACFNRTQCIVQAEEVFRYLWKLTLEQPCNVDVQCVRKAIHSWKKYDTTSKESLNMFVCAIEKKKTERG